MTMECFERGKSVWFDAGTGYPIAGEVTDVNRTRISIKSLLNGKIFVFGIDETTRFVPRIPLPPEGVNDMITMSDLSEASILWNIKIRYEHRQFYTYIGSILVAVNPYYMYHDMYSTDFVRKYENTFTLHTLPAHIFATSSLVHSKMLSDKINQCVVISGESGGGKTQSTKLIMNYLAAVNPGKNKLITEQILEASPLLESFGNAKTVRNDNSSRFGKYVEIYYSQKSIVGAKLSDFLLEKSRIVTHSNDERNYHVFYELLEGFDVEEKRKYGLTTPEKYFYLNQGASMAITSKSDAHDFQSLLTAMKILNFTKNEQDTIFKILAAILHLGNIYFSRSTDDPGHDLIQISSKTEIEWCSHLLALNDQGLLQKLTHKVTEARDERLLTPFNLEQALDSRDAIAKALYSTLFSWLVARINQIVRVNYNVDNSIAILDIFGFENFSTNSFEQLCINYANEALQFHFNQHVFKLEQEEYAKEKLSWKKIDFIDNTDCLDLIAKKPNGILQILDDESNFPKATDQSFLHKCHRVHESNRLYAKPRLLKTTFTIRHYAGEVEYDVRGFLDKNRDLLRSDVIDLFSSSRNEILANMFRDIREVYESHRGYHFKTGRFITMKAKTPTVSAKFSDSLSNLIDTMTRCQPTFIRCIKPNNDKTPNKLELSVVLEQLRNTGMLETVRIRKLGFPRRYLFEQFAKRYRCLKSSSLDTTDFKEITIHILNNLPTKFTTKYQIGLTKVFMRESLEYHLEKERTFLMNKAASTIQRTIKGYIQRKNFEKQRHAIVTLQRQYRHWLEQKKQSISSSNSEDNQPVPYHLLEIPNDLSAIFNRLETWEVPHTEENIIETSRSSNVIPTAQHLFASNSNIGTSTLMKYIQEYTNLEMKWDRFLSPIKEPLTKSIREQKQVQLALALFKLVLRFVNTSEHDPKRDRALGDYIVQMGLMNEVLRDEIILQVINQIWNNIDFIKIDKAWLLLFNCISCFSPSATFYKYVFNFVCDEKSTRNEVGKRKLLAASSSDAPRTYPPTQLEWSANKRLVPMALRVEFFDNFESFGEVESWMTGEQFAYELVSSRGILKENSSGWSVTLEENDNDIELMGHDYILDLISELEVPPCAPVCKSFFLIHDGNDRSSKTKQRHRHVRTTTRSKEWFLKVDHCRSSRLSKTGRLVSSSNQSSPYKYPKHFSHDDQQSIEKNFTKHHSPAHRSVPSKKSATLSSLSSSSSLERSDQLQSFPLPPPPPPTTSITKDLLKIDATSTYSMSDLPENDIPIQKYETNNKSLRQNTPPLLPLVQSTSRSSKEKMKVNDEMKPVEKRVQLHHQPSLNKSGTTKAVQLTLDERQECIRRTQNTFTSSSHSMVDAGCGGHFISKIPALRCFRPTKQHHSRKTNKTSPLLPPPRVVSDYNCVEHPASYYGEFSICSDGPINVNQYEKIGSSIHNIAKTNGNNDEYHLSSIYSDEDAAANVQAKVVEYEPEDVQLTRISPSKDINKSGTKFIKNKTANSKTSCPSTKKKQGNSIFDSESIATITDLPLPCHKSDVEAFLDDLFDRALDPKNLGKNKNKSKVLSTLDQQRLQMISNSCIDPSVRRRGLSNLNQKTQMQKKPSIRLTNSKDQNGKKKKSKNDMKTSSERKKSSKSKKKSSQQLNVNNNNNTMIADNSLSPAMPEHTLILPQIGYPSRIDSDDTSIYLKCTPQPTRRVVYRQPSGFRGRGYDRIRQSSTVTSNGPNNFDKHSHVVDRCYPQPSSGIDHNFFQATDKKNIKLIPINPAVCFATTTSTTNTKLNQSAATSDSNGPVFVPVINISGKKYLPVYLKQATDSNKVTNSLDQLNPVSSPTENYLPELKTSKQINSSTKTPTIIEENEVQEQSKTSSTAIAKPNITVERIPMPRLDSVPPVDNEQVYKQPRLKEKSPTNINKNPVRVPSNIFTRRSPEFQKHLRAKTVRIGKIRWPPPLNEDEIDSAKEQRRILVQRRIQEEIHGGKVPSNETSQTISLCTVTNQAASIPREHSQRSQSAHHTKQPPKESNISNGPRSHSDERRPLPLTKDQPKTSPNRKSSNDNISPLMDQYRDDEDASTNEIVARNQPLKLDFHKTLTPMIGKENFELRKKLFEGHDDSSFADGVLSSNEAAHTSKSSSRQSRQLLNYFTYHNVLWKLKVRKEVFSPLETFDQPLLIELLYRQIVYDTFSAICVRISEAERTNMKTFLASHGVAVVDSINLINKLSIKKAVIEQARQWATYFCRFYPVSMPKYHSGEVQMLGVSHTGVRLVKRTRTKTSTDTLIILETFPFDAIQQISPIRNSSTIDLHVAKKRITIHSHRILKMAQLIEKYLKEIRGEKVKQLCPINQQHHQTKLSSNLASRTSELIRSSSQASLVSGSQTFSELIPSASMDNHTPKPTQNEMMLSSLPTLSGANSIMEFALQHFNIPNKKNSKKSIKNTEWKYQDYTELIKWSKNPIQSPLLRQISDDTTRVARQTFVAIMRFMGDHAMSRSQTDIDCLLFILKCMHKNRTLVDEVICQILKQLTDNKSTKLNSAQNGWKLLAIILNYFIPSESLRPYFVRYLHDNMHQNERLAQLCLNHHEQTIKYGGRKNTPSKAEVDLLTANGRNGGKRQTFLLPGGFPLTLLVTPSMVIGDCLNLLCEQLNISNNLEHDEYSIFIIGTSESASRLLNPNEYLFDILSECVRVYAGHHHLIIKRMLWFTIPMTFNDINASEIFIDFMYHQLVPELLEGTMIIINNNNCSEEVMEQISLLAALQYRASNKIGLPSMREVKHLLPATILKLKTARPQTWTSVVHDKLYSSVESMTPIEAKIKFISLIQTWPLFGMTFYVTQSVDDPSIRTPCLVGIYKAGILFLDMDTRETLFSIPYNDVVSIRRHQNLIDIKYGSLNQPHLLQCQVDRAQDLVALTGRYLSFIGRSLTSALERKNDSQQCRRPPSSITCNEPISTIL